ncbi:HAD family phosphatase [Nocardioides sp. LHD-245]|uniref:HAD family hydrolase n=1 Tax=Nocardioides sp. LHD-245 TaxID=3051387 RepID=UPI0027DEF492|nr:HAD family phosphatase [Nocardioides sp. LHD-245]
MLFDCDGVLVDSEPLVMRVELALIAELGWPITVDEAVAEHLGRSWPAIQANIERHIGRPVPWDFVARAEAERTRLFEQELEPVAGVAEAATAIERDGFMTCVASSGSHRRMALTLGLTGLRDRFVGRIFSAEDVSRGKPAPDLFLHAAAVMDATPASCVVVEDSPSGVEAARAAGMGVIGYAARTPAHLLAEADIVIADMADLRWAVTRFFTASGRDLTEEGQP